MSVRAAGAVVLAMALGAGCGMGGGGGGDPAAPAADSIQTTSAPAGAGSTVATTASGTAGAATAADPAMVNATNTAPSSAPSTAATASATAPASTSAATIVPLYTPPTDPSWNAVIAAKQAHPKVGVYAVVNPANGPGTYSVDYAQGIARLKSAGVVVLGYVATGYTARAQSAVEADIAGWKNLYPNELGGIFFDEQSNRAGDEAHYKNLVKYARDAGMPFTVGNPGQDTSESFVGVFDVMLIYESPGVPPAARLGGWHGKYAPSNFGVIPYATNLDPAFVKTARANVKYIYLNNDTLPNPWDTVPPYFGDLLAALE